MAEKSCHPSCHAYAIDIFQQPRASSNLVWEDGSQGWNKTGNFEVKIMDYLVISIDAIMGYFAQDSVISSDTITGYFVQDSVISSDAITAYFVQDSVISIDTIMGYFVQGGVDTVMGYLVIQDHRDRDRRRHSSADDFRARVLERRALERKDSNHSESSELSLIHI